MTLSRQLYGVMSLLMLLFFAGSLAINLNNSRSYLTAQLGVQAQDTATALGVALQPHLADVAQMETIVDAIYDRGYYQQIVLRDLQGKVLIQRRQPVVVDTVPVWFVELFPLLPSISETGLSNPWATFGRLQVQSHPGLVYQELWQRARWTLGLTLVMFVLSLLLGYGLLRTMLRPLGEVQHQLEAMAKHRFHKPAQQPQQPLPRTRELRQLAGAMNTLSASLEKSFNELSDNARRLHDQANRDPLTSLYNRRSFERQLQHQLADPVHGQSGCLLLVHCDQLAEINRLSGYQRGDRHLNQVAATLRDCLERTSIYRLAGGDFAALLPAAESAVLEQQARALSQQLAAIATTGGESHPVYLGLCQFQVGDNARELMARADLALREAQHAKRGGYCIAEQRDDQIYLPSDSAQWQTTLISVIENRRFEQLFQPVFSGQATTDSKRQLLYHELLTRFTGAQEQPIAPGDLFAMARRLQRLPELEKMIVANALAWLDKQANQDPVAVKLSLTSLLDQSFAAWLEQQLAGNTALTKRLVVELSEADVLAHKSEVLRFIARLHELGGHCCIAHFGNSAQGFQLLRELRPDFIKLDGRLIDQLSQDVELQYLVQTMTQLAHSLDIQVLAGRVEREQQYQLLAESHVDGFQGYLIAPPKRTLINKIRVDTKIA